jgi:sporulation protein YlmC with PRC-barrel domain
MRWSEFSDKEIIDLYNGERLGIMGNADLTVHPETGRIETHYRSTEIDIQF